AVASRLGATLLPHLVLRDALAERFSRDQPLAHLLERDFGLADDAHAMVYASGPEPALRDLETLALAKQQVGSRHAHVLEHPLTVPAMRDRKSTRLHSSHQI